MARILAVENKNREPGRALRSWWFFAGRVDLHSPCLNPRPAFGWGSLAHPRGRPRMLLAGVCAPLPELATPLVSPLPSSAVPLPLAFLLLDSVPALAGCLRIRRVGLSRSGALGGAEKRARCQGKRARFSAPPKAPLRDRPTRRIRDRKSTRLNSSH